jgi:hypothetical protein
MYGVLPSTRMVMMMILRWAVSNANLLVGPWLIARRVWNEVSKTCGSLVQLRSLWPGPICLFLATAKHFWYPASGVCISGAQHTVCKLKQCTALHCHPSLSPLATRSTLSLRLCSTRCHWHRDAVTACADSNDGGSGSQQAFVSQLSGPVPFPSHRPSSSCVDKIG